MIKINLDKVNKIFVLEDSIERIKEFQKYLAGKEVVYTDDVDIAIRELRKTKFDLIFLDHDLDGKVFVDSTVEKTGYHVITCLAGSINEETEVIVHSLNPTGAANMIKAHPFNVVHIPFHLLLQGFKYDSGQTL
jgi:hypothetical protein